MSKEELLSIESKLDGENSTLTIDKLQEILDQKDTQTERK